MAQVIHIAGSKGKGTTAWLLAEALRVSGKKVGLFTSPHIQHENEMIRVDGTPIAKERLARMLLALQDHMSEFEALTEAAFQYFEETGCDMIILECGWGGARDATNTVKEKDLTILTHVELEHTHVLGRTLSEITREKLGICRPGVPLLTLANQAPEVRELVEEIDQVILVAKREFEYFHPDCVGLAVAALDQLGIPMSKTIQETWRQLVIPGRFEVIERGKDHFILDGAHTFDSVRSLQERVLHYAEANGFALPLWGIHILKDKPKDLWTLFPRNRSVWIEIDHERAGEAPDNLPAAKLEEFLAEIEKEEQPQLVVIAGSFRLVEAFKNLG